MSPEVVLGAEKEMPTAMTVTMCVLQAVGEDSGPEGHGCCLCGSLPSS